MFTGRVEHMISGHAARFESPEELLAFFGAFSRGANRASESTDGPRRRDNRRESMKQASSSSLH